jgi:16S rRNA (uracil1498-N3)-methyltransferase
MPDKSYFYAPVQVAAGEEFEIVGPQYNYIANVKRNSPGEELEIVDGRGHIILSQIQNIDKKTVRCIAREVVSSANEIPVHITVAVALIKQQRYEFMVEKATELGAHTIQPLLTQRVVRKGFRGDRLEKKAIAAMEQSERAYLPEIPDPVELKKYIANLDNNHLFVAAQSAESKSLIDLLSKREYDNIIILIGPEGGWSDSELSLFSEQQIQNFHLGRRRLRTETAALSALSQVSLFFE